MTGSGSKFCGQKCVLQGLLGAPLSLLGAPGFTSTNTRTMHTMLKRNNAYQVTIQSHMVAAHNNNTFQLIACSSSPYRFPWFATHFQPWDLSSRSFCMNLLGFCSYGVCVFCWLTVREFQRMEPNLASILNAAFKSVHTMSKMQNAMDNIKGLFERNKIKPSTPRAQRQRSQISATDVCQKKKYAAHRRSHA